MKLCSISCVWIIQEPLFIYLLIKFTCIVSVYQYIDILIIVSLKIFTCIFFIKVLYRLFWCTARIENDHYVLSDSKMGRVVWVLENLRKLWNFYWEDGICTQFLSLNLKVFMNPLYLPSLEFRVSDPEVASRIVFMHFC